MKFQKWMAWGAALLLASCAKERDGETREPESVPQRPVSAHASLEVPGQANLYLTEEMAALVEEAAASGGILTKSSPLDDLVATLGVTSMERLFPDAGEYEERTRREGLHRWYKVSFDEDIPVTRAGESFLALPGVEYVEPVRRGSSTAKNMDDRYWRYMWGVNGSGYDVNVRDVWEKYTVGDPDVVVCVVDGGVQLNHPDLAWNCLSSGHYNYVNSNSTIYPHDHGSHVAGTIAAVSNNSTGITGIAGGDYAAGRRGVSLLSHQVFRTMTSGGKTYDDSGGFETAIKEGADHGALISQNSWGYNFDENKDYEIDASEMAQAKAIFENIPRSLRNAIDYFIKYAGCDNQGNQLPDSKMKGGIVIFAAGNDDIPYGPPANYEPVVAVGAIESDGSRASFSNYGDWVDICAPGNDIYSTVPTSSYASYGGTSMACPHVSGVAALLVSYFGGQGFTNERLKEILLGGARDIGLSSGSKPIGPLVDGLGAILYGDSSEPEVITTYDTSVSGNSIKFSFTTNGNYTYRAFASKDRSLLTSLDPRDPGTGVFYAGHTVPDKDILSGEDVTLQISGLEFETQYYVAMAGANYAGRYATLSAIKTVKTGVNNPPVVGGNENLGSFRQYQDISIEMEIYEPDGNQMTVTTTGNGKGALAQKDGKWYFNLNCQTAKPGSYTMTVTAKDQYGLSTSKIYRYTVLENVAPQYNVPFENCLLVTVGDKNTYEVPEHFYDEDGEPLTYSAASLDNNIAKVSFDSETNELTVEAVGFGMCEVRIRATDAMRAEAMATLKVLVRRPTDTFSLQPEGNILGKTLTVLPGVSVAPTSVRLVSSTGRVVFDHSGEHSAFEPVTLITSALSPGVYTLVVTYDGETIKRTLIKK